MDARGQDVLVWKPFVPDAAPPSFMAPSTELKPDETRICLTAFSTGWCSGGISYCRAAREAAEGLGDRVHYLEVDTADTQTMRAHGISDGIFVDGVPFRADGPPFTAEELRAEPIERYEGKQKR